MFKDYLPEDFTKLITKSTGSHPLGEGEGDYDKDPRHKAVTYFALPERQGSVNAHGSPHSGFFYYDKNVLVEDLW